MIRIGDHFPQRIARWRQGSMARGTEMRVGTLRLIVGGEFEQPSGP